MKKVGSKKEKKHPKERQRNNEKGQERLNRAENKLRTISNLDPL